MALDCRRLAVEIGAEERGVDTKWSLLLLLWLLVVSSGSIDVGVEAESSTAGTPGGAGAPGGGAGAPGGAGGAPGGACACSGGDGCCC